VADDREDIQLNPEHRKLLLGSLQEVITYLQASVKSVGKIDDPKMFLADIRTKAGAAQRLLEGLWDKTYVAREDLEDQERAAEECDPCQRPLHGHVDFY